MIIMILSILVHKAKATEALDLFDSYIGPIAAQSNHVNVWLNSNMTRTNEFVLLEVWKDRESLENHVRSDNFRNILAIMELAKCPPTLDFHTVSSSEGLDLVEKLRAS